MMVESLCWITIHNDMRKAKLNTLLFLLSSSQTFSFFLLDRPAGRWLLAPQASHFSKNQIHVSCPTKIRPHKNGKSHNLSKHINLSLHKHISLEMYYLNNSVIPPTSHNFDEQNSVMSVKAINSEFFPLFKDQQLV